jgi:hypothetical protein
MRKPFEMMVAVLLAVFMLASMAEAAPRKTVRHRPRHSSRVSVDPTTSKKKTSVQAKRRTPRGPSSATPTSARRKTTKPR